MVYNDYSFLIIYVVSIVIGLIWFTIHYYWKNEEKKGRELSPLAKEWMTVSKVAGYLFLILPIILWIYIKIGGLLGIIVLIGAPGAILSMMLKKK